MNISRIPRPTHIRYHLIRDNVDLQIRILGQTVYVTQDPENIKAMLATQFNDFGKGRIFHEQWDFVSFLVRWKSNHSSLETVFSMLMDKFGTNHELCYVLNSINNVSPIYMSLKNMFPR